MDHLPCPRHPIHGPIEVPYVCTEEYDGGPIETYPKRRRERSQQRADTPNGDVSSFVQTWLFFGMLTTIFGRKVNIGEWTCTLGDPHRIVVTTKELSRAAPRWIDEHRAMDEQSSQRRILEIKAALLFVSRLIGSLYSMAENSRCGLDRTIILSIELLGEFLQSALFRASQTRLLPDWLSHSTDEVNWLNHGNLKTSILYQRLRSNGWCPFEVAMLKTKFPGSGLLYVSTLDRPQAAKDHSRCTEFKCFAYQLNEATYKTKHVEDDCNCPYVFDDSSLVHSILLGGSIPLLLFTDSGDSVELNIVEAVPGHQYVAISHVWSDGLGNPEKNALWRCQLRHLSNLVSSVFQLMELTCAPYFWIDTVCCPPESGEAQDLAISRMRDTYEKAACVLVLDSWLHTQPTAPITDCEIMMRIACCVWNRRLWTFQEGALAQKLIFKFADRLFDFEDAVARIYHDRDPVFDLTLKTSIIKSSLDIRSFQRQKMEVALRIKTIISSVKFRSTSVASDEALCLGVMLNLDVLRIIRASTKHEERMATLWRMLSEVPAELAIFDGRRLESEDLRWAPATLMSPINPGWGPIVQYSREHHGQRMAEGLNVCFPGFELSSPPGTIFRVFHFAEEEEGLKTWYEVCCYRVLTSDLAVQGEQMGEGLSVEGRVKVEPCRPKSLAGPVSASTDQVSLSLITQVPIGRPGIPVELRSPGVLATIRRKDGDDNNSVIFVRYECNVTARRVGIESSNDGNGSSNSATTFPEWLEKIRNRPVDIHDDVQTMIMSGKKLTENQMWCVN